MIWAWLGMVAAMFTAVAYGIWHDDRQERAQCQADAELISRMEVDVVQLAACRAERDPYFNHLMTCDGCHAPTSRHCGEGQVLRRAYHVAYHTAKILDLPKREDQVTYYRLLDDDVREQVGATVAARKQAGVAA